MPDILPQIPPVALPEVIPSSFPHQKFNLGEWVRWFQVPNGDFGRIIGVIYTQQASCIATGLHYLVLLDERSPSRDTCACDFAFEEDIEILDKLSLERLQGNHV
ncbi:hypothetical protein I8752_30525 [Nostocaceae cyanobacterium CENA369]|uniref:Uncharacterized protein n=1 Tax=Dendronalium phyllosphericum CENA369 TaxID=1725256 RepID=A0A8J7LIV5_9NOST|nr:hypothetical protein [Dendronalium phyllosphericum]MBH8577228.1 hypothetical protein [Dendronalium phyllosphericum CENA369]